MFVAVAATADAATSTEQQKKAHKKKREAIKYDQDVNPSKKSLSGPERMRRRMRRSLDEDFRTGIGDDKGGRRLKSLSDDDDE